MTIRVFAALGFAVGALGLARLNAFNLTPMAATLEPTGRASAHVFRLENSSSNRVAFQVSMLTLEMGEDGVETNSPATGLFSVFPQQGSLGPGQGQNVRLVWRGPARLEREQLFRFVAEELPVNFTPEEGKAQIRVVLRYLAVVYVRPRNAKPDLKVTSVTRLSNGRFELSVTNAGTGHRRLTGMKLVLTDAARRTQAVPASVLEPVAEENVLAGRARRFVITLPEGFSELAYQANLTTDE